MKRLADKVPVRRVAPGKNAYPLGAMETVVNFPSSIKAQTQLNKWMLQAQKQRPETGKRGRRLTKQLFSVTEAQPPAQRGRLSDASTSFTVGTVGSPPAPPSVPSSLTCVESEQLDKEPQPQVSMTSVSVLPPTPMQPPLPPNRTVSHSKASEGKKRKPKLEVGSAAPAVREPPAQPPSVQLFETPGVRSKTSATTSAFTGISQFSAMAYSDGSSLTSETTPVPLTSIMNHDIGNVLGHPTPKAQAETSAVISKPTFLLEMPNDPVHLTSMMDPSMENMVGLPTPNAQAPTSAVISSSEPPVMMTQAPTSAFISNPHPSSTPSTNTTLVTSPLQNLVNNLTLQYQQEDAIRSRISELDESIASTLATLHGLKREREELQAKETYTRKRRLEVLQCLQGITFGVQESRPELMLPGQKADAGVFAPNATGNANPVVMVPQGPQGAPPFAFDQVTIVQPQGSEYSASLAAGAPASRM
ncbi:uncharacterized protein LOC142566672 [Dermacentor variabilis]|uniref:uncharacterized protein LOC142566672 n=1 Tax=Dermacentor variabilis TaxID=34621 RepID=UPI003F5B416D